MSEAAVTALAHCCWCKGPLTEYRPSAYLCLAPACATRQERWRLTVKKGDTEKLLYLPTPRQVEFHESTAKHTLFGGAAGPGKSHALRWDVYRRCLAYPGYEALLLRRTYPELEKTHMRRAAREAPDMGATFVPSEHVLRFANGSILEFGHCDTDGAISKYLSTEYDWIGFDELVTFDEKTALEIMTRARSSKPGVRAMVKCGSNPGGVGALWVLDFFIDHTPDRERYPGYQAKDWKFVQALLDDNPYRDAEYAQSLTVLAPARYQQLRHGNWRVFDGQFFSVWSEVAHLTDPNYAVAPDAATWFCSMDWGFNAPGVFLWWTAGADGHYTIIDEYKFKETTVKDVAAQVRAKSKDLGLRRVPQTWADPAIWQRTGQVGEAIAETFVRHGVPVVRSNNDRINGWQRVQEMLRNAPSGRPWLQVHPRCAYLTRTLPAAVRDPVEPEDVDTKGDDHALDALRYGAMSRRRFSATTTTTIPLPGTVGAIIAAARGPERRVLGEHSVKRGRAA